ncbi:SAM-dependent methyltransferase [Paractinoplanes tereljensis]|uniref:SAM-dependent methyltransferase n=1 Tax=Paractinoplanes tereljensis TaxID=571912 RepID=UPI0027DDE770|nr:SAM-dependent methyltransferase [Actinoplanes tereljensis]
MLSRTEFPFDTTVAHPARVYNYWLGGKDNFEADRVAGERALAGGAKILPGVRANRAFLRRAVRFLAAEAGVRQFLDIGTGLPSAGNTHEIAQEVAADSRVVYVDNDPIVLAHARALLTSQTGTTAYIDADARDTGRILREAAGTLDFGQPVAVLFLMILQYIPDEDHPGRIVREILDALPAGSYLAHSDTALDISADANVATSAAGLNKRMPTNQHLRTPEQLATYYTGLELVEPGQVQLPKWRPAPDDPDPSLILSAYCGVARKP